MDSLLARMRRVGFIVVLGICLIIYVGLGIVYLQQGPKQKELQDQIRKTQMVVMKPLPSIEELQGKYDAVNEALAPVEVPKALEILVGIARESGINVDPDDKKFNIPPPSGPTPRKVGDSTYQVISFSNIQTQGDPESVLAFIADLDTGQTMETLVLRRVDIHEVETRYTGKEAARRTEFNKVIEAVKEMMKGNGLLEIPYPIGYDGGIAVNDMAAFPDITTSAQERGYAGSGNPRDGYVLWGHDLINADNVADFQTVNYIDLQTTEYYYTCEADGTVRQFDGADLTSAKEYLGSKVVEIEAIAGVSVDLYSKP
jgi:hypothetical protein